MKSILHEIEIYDYEKMITFRLYCSMISFIFCLIIIIIFIFKLIKTCVYNKNKNNPSNVSLIEDYDRETTEGINRYTSFLIEENRNQNLYTNFYENSIIGSNEMFFLIISNFLSSINTIYSSIKYPLGFNYYFDKYSTYCIYLGFFENLFEVSSICWTSVISNLFLTSLNIRLSSSNGNAKLFKEISFSIILPLFLTLFPFYTHSYGPAQTHCSFDYVNYDKTTQFLNIAFIIFNLGNIIFNIYAFYKVINFSLYTLKIILVSNPYEYNELIKYIKLYCLFPINLVISKFLEGLCRILLYYKKKNIYIFYINSIIICLNGFLNSIPSFFLFTGILKQKTLKQSKINDSNLNLSITFTG